MRLHTLSLVLLAIAGLSDRTTLEDPTQAPPDPFGETVAEKLAWPFEGSFAQQRIWHNYSYATEDGAHAGLRFVQRAGTEVRAVAGGVVAVLDDEVGLILAPDATSDVGWWYGGLESELEAGATVASGDVLGRVADRDGGITGLSLAHVKFARDDAGALEVESTTDPLRFFDAPDETKPRIATRMHFVRDETLEEFEGDEDGFPHVEGKVDIIAALGDSAGLGQSGQWGVPVVTLEIVDGEGKRVLSTLVLDLRGPLKPGHSMLPLQVFDDRDVEPYTRGLWGWPKLSFLRLTNTDGDGLVEPEDAEHSWDTTQIANGRYRVIVRAWDLAGNMAERKVGVFVEND